MIFWLSYLNILTNTKLNTTILLYLLSPVKGISFRYLSVCVLHIYAGNISWNRADIDMKHYRLGGVKDKCVAGKTIATHFQILELLTSLEVCIQSNIYLCAISLQQLMGL